MITKILKCATKKCPDYAEVRIYEDRSVEFIYGNKEIGFRFTMFSEVGEPWKVYFTHWLKNHPTFVKDVPDSRHVATFLK